MALAHVHAPHPRAWLSGRWVSPTVLKLLKMATGMRALLDTVVQALPQVRAASPGGPSCLLVPCWALGGEPRLPFSPEPAQNLVSRGAV